MTQRVRRSNVSKGILVPLGNGFSLAIGKHPNKTDDIDIGPNNKNGLSVNHGEILQNTGNSIRVFSAEPILGGVSPSQLLYGGMNPNAVFAAQEQYKKTNRINDDGSHYAIGGNKRNKWIDKANKIKEIPRKGIISSGNTNVDWSGINTTNNRKYNADYINYINNGLIKGGVGKNQRAAILANIIEESGGDPFAVDATGNFRGILQWEKSRYWPGNEIDAYKELDNQVQYILDTVGNSTDRKSWTHGGKGSGYNSLTDAMAAYNSEDDLEATMRGYTLGYVRPAGGIDSYNNRLKVAKQIIGREGFKAGGEKVSSNSKLMQVDPNEEDAFLDTLPAASIIYNKKRNNFFLSPLNWIRQKLYDNISPWGYKHPIKRVIGALFNKKYDYGFDNTRDDIWAEYLNIPKSRRHTGLGNEVGIVENSQYFPNIGKENNKEYKTIRGLFKNNGKNTWEADNAVNNYFNPGIDPEHKDWSSRGFPLNFGENVISLAANGYFGRHTIGNGLDPKRGQYLSIYDKWDITPFGKRYAGKDQSFGIGKPIEFYDRLYLDDYFGVQTKPPANSYYGGYLQPAVSYSDGTNSANYTFKNGGIYIKPSKRGTFTAAAKKHGMGVQTFANKVLANKENYSSAMVKKANFARNANKWHHYLLGGENSLINPLGERPNANKKDMKQNKRKHKELGGPLRTIAEINAAKERLGAYYSTFYNPDGSVKMNIPTFGELRGKQFTTEEQKMYKTLWGDDFYNRNVNSAGQFVGQYEQTSPINMNLSHIDAKGNIYGPDGQLIKVDTRNIPTIDEQIKASYDKFKTNYDNINGVKLSNGLSAFKADLIGAGINAVGSIGSYLINNAALNKLKFTPRQALLLNPVKLKTKINIEPQVAKMRETVAGLTDAAYKTSASSRNTYQKIANARLAGLQAYGDTLAKKENTETELINKDRLNQQSINAANVKSLSDTINANITGKNNMDNTKLMLKAQNKVALINNLASTIAGPNGVIARDEARRSKAANIALLAQAFPTAAKLLQGDNWKNAYNGYYDLINNIVR